MKRNKTPGVNSITSDVVLILITVYIQAVKITLKKLAALTNKRIRL